MHLIVVHFRVWRLGGRDLGIPLALLLKSLQSTNLLIFCLKPLLTSGNDVAVILMLEAIDLGLERARLHVSLVSLLSEGRLLALALLSLHACAPVQRLPPGQLSERLDIMPLHMSHVL